MEAKKILIVDDELSVRESMRMIFKNEYEVLMAGNGKLALKIINEQPPDLVFLDIIMPGEDGIEVLKKIKEISNKVIVIMLTATKTIKTVVSAMKLGAYDYVTKPFDIDEIKLIINKALKNQGMEQEIQYLNRFDNFIKGDSQRNYTFDNIISNTKEMKDIFNIIEQVADSKATVLIFGESGTGKELIARAIHYNSIRKGFPFVAINCAAIPETLIESELFGYEKGAFTDASAKRIGQFEMADKGTLFLDEISELSSATQAKILRVLQEMEFIRVGGVKPVKVDVRVIVATNRDLEKEVSEGRFRSDLFYRINVVPIFIPPLRERKGDIPLLVDYFLSRISSGVKNMKKQISKEALELFVAYDWPGNVRELENVIERLVALTPKNIIDKDDLPANILIGQKVNKLKGDVLGGSIAFNEAEQEFEQEIILNALKKSNFVQTKAANLLGISRRVLKYKMDKYGIEGSEN
ncbi:MAG: hypothetical protein A2149_01950 [Candidatus Schekmanbacteria bacterium RBG_16_38_11]|uniref:Fis family transcriptional regulator n=1 Tax=Candidatus Schekmanbacteria bacterium RBG_16_38_11 TaxID=1817880 RepID=A0A1F7S086_9BACT|nr:MAG: hypothetical protein A2149_01950 [Candidatus Schekmanbacteria bacterium RBG_16_38_11]